MQGCDFPSGLSVLPAGLVLLDMWGCSIPGGIQFLPAAREGRRSTRCRIRRSSSTWPPALQDIQIHSDTSLVDSTLLASGSCERVFVEPASSWCVGSVPQHIGHYFHSSASISYKHSVAATDAHVLYCGRLAGPVLTGYSSHGQFDLPGKPSRFGLHTPFAARVDPWIDPERGGDMDPITLCLPNLLPQAFL